MGAEPAHVLGLWETVSAGNTLKFECGRYTKARANKPATGEDTIFVVHLSLNPERRLSGGNDYTIYFVAAVYQNHRDGVARHVLAGRLAVLVKFFGLFIGHLFSNLE